MKWKSISLITEERGQVRLEKADPYGFRHSEYPTFICKEILFGSPLFFFFFGQRFSLHFMPVVFICCSNPPLEL